MVSKEEFDKVFRQKGLPDDIPEHRHVWQNGESVPLAVIIKEAGLRLWVGCTRSRVAVA